MNVVADNYTIQMGAQPAPQLLLTCCKTNLKRLHYKVTPLMIRNTMQG